MPIIKGFQFIFIAFPGLMIIPSITGFQPSIILLTAGLGTLVFNQFIPNYEPILLSPSIFCIVTLTACVQIFGIPGTLFGCMVVSITFLMISFFIQWQENYRDYLLPPIILGPVIMIMGLVLLPNAAYLIMGKSFLGDTIIYSTQEAMSIALITLLVTCAILLLLKSTSQYVALFWGVIAGYGMAVVLNVIDYSMITQAPWIGLPSFQFPQVCWEAALYLIPVGMMLCIEHMTGLITIQNKTHHSDDQLMTSKTMATNGVISSVLSCIGAPPITINSGICAMSSLFLNDKYNSTFWASCLLILLSFFNKLTAVVENIPLPAVGGVMILICGSLIIMGIKQLMSVSEIITDIRSMIVLCLIFMIGLGQHVYFTNHPFQGVMLAYLFGIVFNYVLPEKKASYPLGVMVYGSFMGDPGNELLQSIVKRIPVITPFKVEYARKSKNRSDAPVLVPVNKGGAAVNAEILILKPDISLDKAYDMLYRRAINFVDEDSIQYKDKDKHENSGLTINKLTQVNQIETVLYTSFAPNIQNILNDQTSLIEKGKILAYFAIESVNMNTFCSKRDGIRCLIEDIANGVRTPLTQPYENEILIRGKNATNLNEARIRIARLRGILPETTHNMIDMVEARR